MKYSYSLPTKVYEAPGIIDSIGTLSKPYGRKCLLVTTEHVQPLDTLFTRIIHLLEASDIQVVHFDQVVPNPTTTVVEQGIEAFKTNSCEFVVGVGGGSSLDTAKAIALLQNASYTWDKIFATFTSPFETYPHPSKRHVPMVAVPTTAGTGSEVTQAAVISYGDEKYTIFHQNNFSDICLMDAGLTLTLPSRLTASTGFDAFTHAFESYISSNASSISEMLSITAVTSIVKNLPAVMNQPDSLELRREMLLAQTYAGMALANSGAYTPHPLSEIIGGITHISHGEALAIIFPAFCKAQYQQHIEKFARITRLFDGSYENKTNKEAAAALSDIIRAFITRLGLSTKLSDFHICDDQIQRILNHPSLEFLPFADETVLKQILSDSL